MRKWIVIHPSDNVATALFDLEEGEIVSVYRDSTEIQMKLSEPIKFGHKLSLAFVAAGEDVIKYGETIGVASQNIMPGEHVHVHNLESQRGRGDKCR